MTTLRVDSKDPLELTVTKTSLGLLLNLGQVKMNKTYVHFCIWIVGNHVKQIKYMNESIVTQSKAPFTLFGFHMKV